MARLVGAGIAMSEVIEGAIMVFAMCFGIGSLFSMLIMAVAYADHKWPT